MEIIEAHGEHCEIIADIAEKTWPVTYGSILKPGQMRYMLDEIYSKSTLLNVMEDQTQTFILLKDNHNFEGFASYGPRSADPSIFKVHKLYVLPNNQGKGYGRLLIDEIKTRTSNAGARTLDLNVNRYNPAVKFYTKMGFKI